MRKMEGETREAALLCRRRFVQVGGRVAAVALQQAVAANFADHLLGIAVAERRDPKADVGEDLHMDSAKTESDERAK